MRRRIGLGWLVVTWITGYAIGACVRTGEAPPVVQAGPVPSSTVEANTSRDVHDDGAPTSAPSPPAASDGGGGRLWCHERGLTRLDPCPGGGQTDGGPIPEDGLFCCETGDSEPYACMTTLLAARSCNDPAGVASAERRVEEGVRAHGDPCLDQEFRDALFRFESFRRLCAERGHPPTVADAPQFCHVTDVSCPPEWRTVKQ